MKNLFNYIFLTFVISVSFELQANGSDLATETLAKTEEEVLPPGCTVNLALVTVSAPITYTQHCGYSTISYSASSSEALVTVAAFNSVGTMYPSGSNITSGTNLAIQATKDLCTERYDVIGTSKYIAVTANPNMSVSLSNPTTETHCIGNDFIITANPVNAGSNPSYIWYKAPQGSSSFVQIGGQTAATLNTYNIVPGTYVFKCKVTLSSGLCSAETTKTISIPPTIASLTVSQPSSHCSDTSADPITVTDNADASFYMGYQFKLYNGATLLQTLSVHPSDSGPLSKTFSAQPGGETYTVKVSSTYCTQTYDYQRSYGITQVATTTVLSEDQYQYICPGANIEIRTGSGGGIYTAQFGGSQITSGITYKTEGGYEVIEASNGSLNVPGTYYVGLSGGSCTSTSRTKVRMEPLNNPDIPVLLPNEDFTVTRQCGETADILLKVDGTADLAPGPIDPAFPSGLVEFPVEYQWYNPAGQPVGAKGDTYLAQGLTIGTHNYTVKAFAQGCESQVSMARTVPAVVNTPTPTITLSHPEVPLFHCLETPFVITANTTNVGIDPTYKWFKDGFQLSESGSTLTNASITPGSYLIKCEININALGCAGTVISDEQTIYIPPTINSVTVSQPSSFCYGVSPQRIKVTDTALGDYYQNYFFELWEDGGALIETKGATNEVPLDIEFSEQGEGSYIVKLASKTQGCADYEFARSVAQLPTVPGGTVKFEDKNQIRCEGEDVLIHANVAATLYADAAGLVPVTTGITHEVDVSEPTYQKAIRIDASVFYKAVHTYYVKITGGTCDMSTTYTKVDIDRWSKPVAPILNNESTCFSGKAVLTTSGFSTYEWYRDGVLQGTAGSPYTFDLVAANTGDYQVKGLYAPNNICGTDLSNIKTVSLFSDDDCDNFLNSVIAQGFDDTEAVLTQSKNYFDLAGEALQSQSTTFDKNGVLQVMASQSIKDTYGRDVLQTLAAPLNRTDFLYNHNFVTTNESGSEVRYQSEHFDGSAAAKVAPKSVANTTPGTLGWYYSANNTLEDNVPQTSFPYTRTDFYEDGSGEVKRSAAPGDELHMGKNRESITKTLPVGNQSKELTNYNSLRRVVLGLSTTPELEKVYKQVSMDPDKKEVVSYQTEQGTIATAIVKDGTADITYTANADGQVEVHVPYKGTDKTTVGLSHKAGETFKVLNKIKDETDEGHSGTPSSVDLLGGIYTIQGVSSVNYNPGYAEYSYNIYDNAGRLAASIAPLGIDKMNILTKTQAQVEGMLREDLTYTTLYTYDFQGRLIEMKEPDAGITKYFYRKDGSIRFSENALQKDSSWYSYTCYDVSGRPIESGEYIGTDTYDSRNDATILETKGLSGYPEEDRRDWVETHYDLAATSLVADLATYMDSWYTARYTATHGYNTGDFAGTYQQDFLEGAVSYTENENVTTWYSYDEFGQVTFIVMKYNNMDGGQYFTIDYQYDYFGNVIEVAYQKHFAGESFYHHYEYNNNQQLTKVYTSQAGVDDPYKYLHATYHYYLHGPLKRLELAENLQGLDYTYTAQGWLKAINSPANNYDPGGDGSNTFFSDAFGMEIDYYDGDHTSNKFSSVNAHIDPLEIPEQYSGNIQAITWGRQGTVEDQEFEKLEDNLNEPLTEPTIVEAREIINLNEGFDSNGFDFEVGINPTAVKDIPLEIEAQQNEYTYDFKNQLKSSSYTDAVTSETADDRYAVKGLDYDANGNIQTLKRYGENALTPVDDFTYDYNYEENNNQLEEVPGYSSYEYNSIGQMTAAIGRGDYGSQYFAYDVTGKVTGIYGSQIDLDNKANAVATYEYDDRGFRIMKKVGDDETWYVRDASGNIMSIYEGQSNTLSLTELPIYGSGKIGTSFRDLTKHKYSYELTDHLGNVRTVVSKLKFYEVATMETENQFTESAVFENLNTHRQQDALFNTTNIKGDNSESYSVRLDGTTGVVGPAMSRAVKKGDKISFNVNAMYVDGYSSSGLASNVFGLVASAYSVTAGGETQAIYDGLEIAVANAGAFLANPPSGVPKAYIQCLVFDKDFNDITPNDAHAMVSLNAAGNNSSAENIGTAIDQPLEITEDGYIYVYVANETQGALVNFDDMTVSILGFDISEMTDYYPFGSVASHWEKEPYRFGYQGQFAEEDEETGFNHFEAREYDGKIGRWMVPDPARQYPSPYVAYANNPINRVDPDGGTDLTTETAGIIVGAFAKALLGQMKRQAELEAYAHRTGDTEFYDLPSFTPPVEISGIGYADSWLSSFSSANEHFGPVSFDMNGYNVKANAWFDNSSLHGYNSITQVKFVGHTANSQTGDAGYYIFFLGKKGRLIGTLMFNSEEVYDKVSSTYKALERQNFLDALKGKSEYLLERREAYYEKMNLEVIPEIKIENIEAVEDEN